MSVVIVQSRFKPKIIDYIKCYCFLNSSLRNISLVSFGLNYDRAFIAKYESILICPCCKSRNSYFFDTFEKVELYYLCI